MRTLALLGLFLAALPSFADRSPNIILILCDDLGWSDLGCYGSDLHETPTLDQLAAQGVRFTDAYSASPVCTPTRAAILTGQHPGRLQMTIWSEGCTTGPKHRKLLQATSKPELAREYVTVADALKAKGYLTLHVGKWHLGSVHHYPETQGFDVNFGGTFWGAPASFFHPYSGLFGKEKEYRYVPGLGLGNEGGYLTDTLADRACQLIGEAGDRPFFLNLWHHAPHTPIEAQSEIIEKYRGKVRPGMKHQNATYAAMIESIDESVRRVLEILDQRRLSIDTVIIFTSDNGGYTGKFKDEVVTNNSPLRSGKGSCYEGGVRVPLIIRWLNGASAGARPTPVLSCDLYSTILELAGVAPPADVPRDGVSLVPLLRNPEAKLRRDALHFHYPHYYETTTPVSSIRDGDKTLLHYYDDDHFELYDLSKDLGQTSNLAASMPAEVARLQDRLDYWLKSVNAQMPMRNPDSKEK